MVVSTGRPIRPLMLDVIRQREVDAVPDWSTVVWTTTHARKYVCGQIISLAWAVHFTGHFTAYKMRFIPWSTFDNGGRPISQRSVWSELTDAWSS